MRPNVCYQCGVELRETGETCHKCGAVIPTDLPNYPRFKAGGGVFMAMWVLFISLVVILAVSWLTNMN